MSANWVSRLPMFEALDGDDLSPVAEANGVSTSTFLPFIAGLSRLMTTEVKLDTLLDQTVTGLIETLPDSACASIYLKQDGREGVTLAAQRHQCVVDGVAPKPRTELAAQVVEYVKPITLMVRHAAGEPFSPVLGLPLSVSGSVLGALIIETDASVYGEANTALLNLVAAQLALALENYRLHQQVVALSGQAAVNEHFAILCQVA